MSRDTASTWGTGWTKKHEGNDGGPLVCVWSRDGGCTEAATHYVLYSPMRGHVSLEDSPAPIGAGQNWPRDSRDIAGDATAPPLQQRLFRKEFCREHAEMAFEMRSNQGMG